jgi:ribosomal protein S27AE
MPYKFEYTNKRINREDDNRVKLSIEDRKEIKKLYGTISQRKIAKMFNVSRRLIIFIGCPEKYKKNLIQRQENGGSKIYYDKEKSTISKRKHRKHKQELNLKNKLVDKMKLKKRCPLCKEWFVASNGNRIYCFKCSPKKELINNENTM